MWIIILYWNIITLFNNILFYTFFLIFYWEILFWLNCNNSLNYLKIDFNESKWWKANKKNTFPFLFEILSDIIRCSFLFKDNKINYTLSIILIFFFYYFYHFFLFIFLLGFVWGIIKKIYAFVVSLNNKISIFFVLKKDCFLLFNLGDAFSNLSLYLFINKYFNFNKNVFFYNKFFIFFIGSPYYILNHIFLLSEVTKKIILNTEWDKKNKAYWLSILIYDVKQANKFILNAKINNFKYELQNKKIIIKNLTVNLNPHKYEELLCLLYKYELSQNHNWNILKKFISPDLRTNFYTFKAGKNFTQHAAIGFDKNNITAGYYGIHSSQPQINILHSKNAIFNPQDYDNKIMRNDYDRWVFEDSVRYDAKTFTNNHSQVKYFHCTGIIEEKQNLLNEICNSVVKNYIQDFDNCNNAQIIDYKIKTFTLMSEYYVNSNYFMIQPADCLNNDIRDRIVRKEDFSKKYMTEEEIRCYSFDIPLLNDHKKKLTNIDEIEELYETFINGDESINYKIKLHKSNINLKNFVNYFKINDKAEQIQMEAFNFMLLYSDYNTDEDYEKTTNDIYDNLNNFFNSQINL